MMIIFEFRDFTPIEAFVLAPDLERAEELFDLHLRMHGGDPDTIMWRQWLLDDLSGLEQSKVGEALALDREGLLICDRNERWVFITPVGEAAMRGEPPN